MRWGGGGELMMETHALRVWARLSPNSRKSTEVNVFSARNESKGGHALTSRRDLDFEGT